MSEHQMKASEMNEAQEVFDVIFPSGDEPAEVLHPREEPFDFPSPAISPQFAPILGLVPAAAPVGSDHFDVVFFGEPLVERVRVISFVADEPGREFVEKASGKNFLNKLALGRRSALHRYGERNTVINGDSDDLGALAAPRGADGKAPFLALAKVASTNASSRFSLPCSCNRLASKRSASSSFPLRIHCWNLRWQVWYGGYFSGSSRHCAPVPSTQNTPLSTARVSCQGRPRLSSRRCGLSTGSITAHCSSVSSQRPVTALRGHPRAIPYAPVSSLKCMSLPVSSSTPPEFTPEQEACYRDVLEVLNTEEIPYAVGGAFALHEYCGIWRDTKDLDLILEPASIPGAMKRLNAAGYTAYIEDPIWLAKAYRGQLLR
jgi:hypothetical protein